jgi:hypothetical protein
MQALILEDDPTFQAQLAQALMGKGFNVLCVETLPAAEAFLRLDMADVLVFGERIGGRLSHTAALLAECRNPLVAAVLLTDRTGPELDELFDLMPSLVGILGRRVAPEVVTQVVMAAVAEMASDTVRGRLAARWSAAEAADEQATDLPSTRMVPSPASFTVAETALWPGEGAQVLSRNAGLSPAAFVQEPESKVDPAPTAGEAHARTWLSTLQEPPPAPEAEDEDCAVVEVAVTAAPQAPVPALPLRPSANSLLARVMAAGNRALSLDATGAEEVQTERPRSPLLSAWSTPQTAAAGAPAAPAAPTRPPLPAWCTPRSAAASAPAAPVSPSLPPLPRVTRPERRLNLA